MQYKEQIKENELITKIRIVRYIKKEHVPIVAIAKSFSCHRNTISNIIRTFEKLVSPEDQTYLLQEGGHLTREILADRYRMILNRKRTPKTHKRSASKKDEQRVVLLFTKKKIRVGSRTMQLILERRFGKGKGLAKLTPGQLRGIYKRNSLKTDIVRSANGERRHLYDYQAISSFAFMHLDVKHILDKHALPRISMSSCLTMAHQSTNGI